MMKSKYILGFYILTSSGKQERKTKGRQEGGMKEEDPMLESKAVLFRGQGFIRYVYVDNSRVGICKLHVNICCHLPMVIL